MSFATKRRWLLVALHLAAAPAWVGTAAAQTDLANAQRAYDDFLHDFWEGSPAGGHFVGRLVGSPEQLALGRKPVPKGYFWGYGHGMNVLYSWWKFGPASGRADAAARLGAMWAWTRASWSLADMHACGGGTTSTASDDATWGAQGLLELAEVTGDKEALAYARAMLDGAWDRWHDDTLGGGIWYSDTHRAKSNYQASYALATYHYFQLTGDETYRARAVGLENWAAAVLLRDGQTVAGHVYPKDGLYWMGVTGAGLPDGFAHPNHIEMTASNAMIEAQMAFAVLDARLFAATGDEAYRRRARVATEAIKQHERVPGTDIYLNDRDPFVNGFAAALFAHDVVKAPNLLTAQQMAEHTAYLLATARSIAANDRSATGSYGGDWQGPYDGVWSRHGAGGEKLLVGAQAINLVIAGAIVAP
jgi:hypothetical protein